MDFLKFVPKWLNIGCLCNLDVNVLRLYCFHILMWCHKVVFFCNARSTTAASKSLLQLISCDSFIEMQFCKALSFCYHQMDCVKRIWYLSPMRAAKIQASLRIRAVSPEPPLLAHTSQKARSLAPLNGWACAVKICHDGMLEDTNSLDGAQMVLKLPVKGWIFFSLATWLDVLNSSCMFTSAPLAIKNLTKLK